MASMISGMVQLAIDACIRPINDPQNHKEFFTSLKLTPRARRALLILLEKTNPNEWVYPRELVPACGSETKTTETWRELDMWGFLELTNETTYDKKKRPANPTRFRLKADKNNMFRILLTLGKYHYDFAMLMLDTPYYFTRNKEVFNEVKREIKEHNKKTKGGVTNPKKRRN